ncbi:MAG: phosphodiester glycosidase family protein [Erysipelotrichales bacterium]|nr:phosphodiester glycosidase family protein [Erysipelotrichales bacterium]
MKKILILLITTCAALLVPRQGAPFHVLSFTDGIGDIRFEETRTIANGLDYTHKISQNWAMQSSHTITYDPLTAAVAPFVEFGPFVFGGNTMSSLVAQATNRGKTVVAGINGDFFCPAGTPLGMMIQNGRLISGSNGLNPMSVGFLADGSAIIERPQVAFSFTASGGTPITFNHLNRPRNDVNANIHLLTGEFSQTTRSTVNGAEVVLDINSGEIEIGGTLNATVSHIVVSGMNTPIGPNQVVLVTDSVGRLGNLDIGQSVVFNFEDTRSGGSQWSDVQQSVSGSSTLLVENGQVNPALANLSDRNVFHPRTTLGIRADGSIVLHQIDGRQPGFSDGLTDTGTAEYMVSQGAVTAIRLDGGGSSTTAVRFPGDDFVSIVNSPSDGGERSNANAILLVATEQPTGDFAMLHAYPGRILALEGTRIPIEVKATDENFFSVQVPPVEFIVTGGVGSVENGIFSARSGSGTGQIIIRNGSIEAIVDVEIIDTVDEIYANIINLSLSPGEVVDNLFVRALYQGMIVTASVESFDWTLDNPLLGTLEPGRFTATGATGVQGNIIISFKDQAEARIRVNIGQLPIIIADFEHAVVGQSLGNWWARNLNGATSTVSINDDYRYTKFGERSLRVDFDMRNTTGTGAVEVFQVPITGNVPANASQRIALPGNPTHLGMWVFGTFAQGAWIRCQFHVGETGSAQFVDVSASSGVNWTGWRYVEATIVNPNAETVFIQFPVRILATNAAQRISGTIFVDNIRAVYGFRDDDEYPPVIENVAPVEDAVVATNMPVISADLLDFETGVNRSATRLWIDGDLVDPEMYNFTPIPNGFQFSYVPNFENRLRYGQRRIRIRAEDYFGNFTIHEWRFTVFADSVQFQWQRPTDQVLWSGARDSYIISVDTFDNFEEFHLEFEFNHLAMEVTEIVVPDPRIFVNYSIDNSTGRGEVTLSGMHNYTQQFANLLVIQLRWLSGPIGEAEFRITQSDVYDSNLGLLENYNMFDNFSIPVDYLYFVRFLGSTINRDTVLTVTDRDNRPIEGAEFEIINSAGRSIVGLTDENGELTTDVIGQFSPGTILQVRAIRAGIYSSITEIPVVEPLGTASPDHITVNVGVDPSTSMSFAWQTYIFITGSEVRIAPREGTSLLMPAEFRTVSSDSRSLVRVLAEGGRREVLFHAVNVDELLPNTEYVYQVGYGGNWSSVRSFRTTPAGGDISFLYYTDPQAYRESGYEPLQQIYTAALDINPDIAFTVTSGDIVDNADLWQQWVWLNNMVGDRLSSIPHAMGSGNHETIANVEMFRGTFANPLNGIPGLERTNYYFEVGDAIFAFMDSEAPTRFDEQIVWLRNVMNNSEARWRFVLMHRGPFPLFYVHQAQRAFNDVFDELAIDVVFNGHDHIYSRTIARGNEFGVGTTYITGGSAGTKFYDVVGNPTFPETIFDLNYQVFSVATFNENRFELTAYALKTEGITEIDHFVLEKADPARIEINNSAEISSGDTVTLSATVFDEEDEEISVLVVWSLKEPVAGISINGNILELMENIASGTTFTVVARAGPTSSELLMTVRNAAHSIQLDIAGTIDAGSSLTLNGRVFDNTNTVVDFTIVWSLSEQRPGVSISGNQLSVGGTIANGTIIVIVATVGSVTQNHSITVSNLAHSITINSANTVQAGGNLNLSGSVFNNNNHELNLSIIWSLRNPVTGVTVAGNVLTVASTVAGGTTIIVVATFGTVSNEQIITVQAAQSTVTSIVADFNLEIRRGRELTLIGTAYSEDNALTTTVTWTLRNAIEGVSIQNGVLVIASDVETGTEIVLVASAEGFTQEFTVVVLSNVNIPLITSLVVGGVAILGLAVFLSVRGLRRRKF